MFATNRLNTGRYVSLAAAFLPPVLILALGGTVWMPGSEAASSVKGRPASAVFGIVWWLLTFLWAFAMVVVTFRFEDASLVAANVFHVMTLLMSLIWLWQYKKGEKTKAAQLLLLTLLFAVLLQQSCSTGVSDDAYANSVAALTLAPLPVWLVGATLFNYLEVNV